MLERARTIVFACAALASAGCPSLDALECHGASCADGSPSDGSATGDGSTTADGSSIAEAGSALDGGIFCGAVGWCAPAEDECCMADNGQTACTSMTGCTGTDIFCDDPSQCPTGPCWICVNGQGFQGTSCDYATDIVGNDRCDASNALQLCHSSSQCEAGTSCKPLPVPPLGTAWFQACQP